MFGKKAKKTILPLIRAFLFSPPPDAFRIGKRPERPSGAAAWGARRRRVGVLGRGGRVVLWQIRRLAGAGARRAGLRGGRPARLPWAVGGRRDGRRAAVAPGLSRRSGWPVLPWFAAADGGAAAPPLLSPCSSRSTSRCCWSSPADQEAMASSVTTFSVCAVASWEAHRAARWRWRQMSATHRLGEVWFRSGKGNGMRPALAVLARVAVKLRLLLGSPYPHTRWLPEPPMSVNAALSHELLLAVAEVLEHRGWERADEDERLLVAGFRASGWGWRCHLVFLISWDPPNP
jgi:hypothetical protein